jgi:hypothetical protein
VVVEGVADVASGLAFLLADDRRLGSEALDLDFQFVQQRRLGGLGSSNL